MSRSSSASSSSSNVIFTRRKGGESQHAGPVRVTRQMLESLTYLSLTNAATKLGLCATSFKKACRREGIMTWPYKRGCALALEREEHASKIFKAANATSAIVMNSISIEESSFALSSSHSEVDSTSSSSTDTSSGAAFSLSSCSAPSPSPPAPSTTSSSSSPSYSSDNAEEPTYTKENADAYVPSCAAKDVNVLERIDHGFFSGIYTEEDTGAADSHFLEQDFFSGDLDLSYFRDAATFDQEDSASLRMAEAPM